MLRDYQRAIKSDIYNAWSGGARNVLAVAPTGAGKTRIKADIAAECGVPFCAIAHRQELVMQVSLALAHEGVPHRIIAPGGIIQAIIREQIKQTGRSWYRPDAEVGVAGVDTLIRIKSDQWLARVQIWDIDEAHHVLPSNKWGKAASMFPNARGLGVTATPVRADKQRLGGMFQALVVGPTMRELITRGYLADYRIYVPAQSIALDNVKISDSTGDYNASGLRDASHKSTITGDIVRDYQRFASGKRGITFVVDIETAVATAEAFNAAGIRAEAVSSKTPDSVRAEMLDRLRTGDILQLVNVDLFGEGMDCPAIEVVSMGRPTQSYGLYVQQFGRGLRPSPGKTHGIIIDHVGNVIRHNLPDVERVWSLDDDTGGKRSVADENVPLLTVCIECCLPRERFRKICPYCGAVAVPVSRGSIEHVDGDLLELSPEAMDAVRRAMVKADELRVPYGADGGIMRRLENLHKERLATREQLRSAISNWAGVEHHINQLTDSEIYRKFYLQFDVDIMSAQTLTTADTLSLIGRIVK